MAYEISWSTNTFFNAGAQGLSLGRISPYEFDDGTQRCLPEQRLYHHFVGTSYEWLFMGSFWDRLQTAAIDSKESHWKAPDLLSSIPKVQAFVSIVNEIICLTQLPDLPKNIALNIHVYYDAHVPLMCAIEDALNINILPLFHKYAPNTMNVIQESGLPDIINEHLDCSFWNENKTKMKPIVHLMCKALPQRCQIRNLREIISNYCQTDDTVHEFMRSALLCSLLGMYEHCRFRLTWSARKEIIRRLIYSNPNRTQLQEWLFTNYQHLLFYTIKEFMTFSMPMIPALYDELCVTYKWNIFENAVRTAMDRARATIQENVLQGTSIKEWMQHVEAALIIVNKQQLVHLYRPQRQTFCQTVLAMCNRMDEQTHNTDVYSEFPSEHVHLLRLMTQRVPRTHIHINWLKYFNVQQTAIDSLCNMYQHVQQNAFRTDLRKLLNTLTRYDFEAVRALFAAFRQTHSVIRVFQLPAHYYEAQCKALRRRYGLVPGEELGEHVGQVYLCLSCNTFKGFIVNKTSKVNNLFANGHSKIIVDDETLKCYCGRRCEKSDTKKRNRVEVFSLSEQTEQTKRRAKKEWKIAKKNVQNKRSAETECMQINITGVILQFYDNLYLFCPSCANPTTFHADQHDRHGFTCGQCRKGGTLYTSVSCSICGIFKGKDTWLTVVCINEEKENETIAICNSCHKPWIKNYDGNVPSAIIEQQRTKIKIQRINKKE